MNWQTVESNILDEALSPIEIQKIRMKRQEAVDNGEPDPVGEIVTAVPAEIRSRIAAGGRSRLEGGGCDIPRELRWVAVALVRWRCLVRFALGVTDERRADWDRANKVMDDLSNGAYVLAADGGDSTPHPHYSGRPIRWGPRTRNGVM